MLSLLVTALIFLLVVCLIAAIVAWILSNIPGLPAWSSRIVWAVAGIVVLIYVLDHVSALGVH